MPADSAFVSDWHRPSTGSSGALLSRNTRGRDQAGTTLATIVFMEAKLKLGISQSETYDGGMEAQIGARVRERLKSLSPPVTQAQMAARLELTPDAFSRSLSGNRAFTATELVKLAGELGTSAHWFVTGEQDPFAVTFAGRHTYDPQVTAYVDVDWDATRQRRDDVALAYIQAYGNDPVRPRRRGVTDVNAARQQLVSAGGGGFVRQLAQHVEAAFGIDVVRLSDVNGEARADFALALLGREVIVLDASAYWFRENFSIAHELAHVLLGHLSAHGEGACTDANTERAANAFAAELLTPEKEIRAIHWSILSARGVADFVWKAGVSTKVVAARLRALKIVAGSRAADALDLATHTLIQRELPHLRALVTLRMQEARETRFPEHLVTAHSLAVSQGKLGPETLAWMLKEPVELIRDELVPKVPPADLDELAAVLGLND